MALSDILSRFRQSDAEYDEEGYEEEPYINEDEEPQIAEDAETDGDED